MMNSHSKTRPPWDFKLGTRYPRCFVFAPEISLETRSTAGLEEKYTEWTIYTAIKQRFKA